MLYAGRYYITASINYLAASYDIAPGGQNDWLVIISYVNSAILGIQIVVLYLALAHTVFYYGVLMSTSYLNMHKMCDIRVSSYKDKEIVEPYSKQLTFPPVPVPSEMI